MKMTTRIKLPHRNYLVTDFSWAAFPPYLRSKIMTRMDLADLKLKEVATLSNG
ncbi:MAG: hypothetical protein MK031_09405 [Alphaproteobacteria bacterium]|nr:hypothetical protein [Alphaproteobacteria bacterium]